MRTLSKFDSSTCTASCRFCVSTVPEHWLRPFDVPRPCSVTVYVPVKSPWHVPLPSTVQIAVPSGFGCTTVVPFARHTSGSTLLALALGRPRPRKTNAAAPTTVTPRTRRDIAHSLSYVPPRHPRG